MKITFETGKEKKKKKEIKKEEKPKKKINFYEFMIYIAFILILGFSIGMFFYPDFILLVIAMQLWLNYYTIKNDGNIR